MAKKKIVCVGSAAIDIKGYPSQGLIIGSSAPGTTYFTAGGVARNMAENFAKLGCESYLLSTIGVDTLGEFILNETGKSGVRTEFVENCLKHPTAMCILILTNEGAIQYGVFGGSITKQISPAYLARHAGLLRSADLLATQTVLSIESLIYLSNVAQEYTIPLFVNATSVPLARNLLAVIDKAPSIGANQKEAESLVGFTISSPSEAIQAGQYLLEAGAREVIITLGPQGAVYCNSSSAHHCRALPARIVDTMGAGDALYSGFLSCFLSGQSEHYSLEYGLTAASLTIESQYSVSPLLSEESIKFRIANNAGDSPTLK